MVLLSGYSEIFTYSNSSLKSDKGSVEHPLLDVTKLSLNNDSKKGVTLQ